MRIGIGYDVHAFERGTSLIMGGVNIPYCMGLKGHSDADVLIHAIMDAILGAAALGDIGMHFPDNDISFKGISSMILLKRVLSIIKEEGYNIGNIDGIIIAQKPRMSPYIDDMRKNISQVLGIDISQINIKATTTEGLGFEGRQEGIAAQAIALLLNAKS